MDPGAFAIGSVFQGRYRIVRRIQVGGTATVYEAIQLETERPRALKIMLPEVLDDAQMRARFRREATVTAAIHSDHIVETLDAGIDEATGAPFLVMELLRGEDLATLVSRTGRLSAGRAVILLAQLASALDKIHAAGIVHRDLKPENLFLTTGDDGSPRLKVLDFGIAKLVAPSGTRHATRAVGTPVYMSPEQIRGDAGIAPATDLHALGHIAYTLLVGAPYWHEESQGDEGLYRVLHAVSGGAKESASERARRGHGVTLPPSFDAWFARATALAPEERFPSAGGMIRALGGALGVESEPAPSEDEREPAPSGRENRDGTVPLPQEGVSKRAPFSKTYIALMGTACVLGGLALLGFAKLHSPSAPAARVQGPPSSVEAPALTTGEPSAAKTTDAVVPVANAEARASTPADTAPTAARTKKMSLPSRQPRSRASSGVTRSCNPPFTVDDDGMKHAKPECL